MNKVQYPIYQEDITEFRDGPIEDNMFHETGFPLGNSYPPKYMSFQPVGAQADNEHCLLGRDGCVPLCSGYTNNPCNIVAPIPGPQWQVQNAATVQRRLTNQDYTPSKCPLGPTVLRDAPGCQNSDNNSRQPYMTKCVASQPVPRYQ